MANTGVLATIIEAELQADANSHQGSDRDNREIGEETSLGPSRWISCTFDLPWLDRCCLAMVDVMGKSVSSSIAHITDGKVLDV